MAVDAVNAGTSVRTRSPWPHSIVEARLAAAGITVNGANPWDPQIHTSRAIRRVLFHGTLGAGETYMDGDWDCESLDVLAERLLRNGERSWAAWSGRQQLSSLLFNRQAQPRAAEHVRAHYDIGDDLYSAMLGTTMTYSCGYWREAATLDEAQDEKHSLVCRKLGLRQGHRVLDIGCGWGAFLKFAAERYGVMAVGVTLSPTQAAAARQRCHGLPVEIRLQDYRDVAGEFDRVVSIGMFEHVGPRNYRDFFATVARVLTSEGLALLHTIGGWRSARVTDPWIDRYIFPGSVLPSATHIASAIEDRLVMEDWQNIGADYDRTLMTWHANLDAAWQTLPSKYDERFRRMWRYYLLTCAGSFRARYNQVWQIVLSPTGVRGGYRRPL